METVKAEITVQEWGNGLGVRITAPLAKAARLTRGTPVTVEVVEGGLLLRTGGRPRLTLAQKLKAFDPAVHGGEVTAGGRAPKSSGGRASRQCVGPGPGR